LHEFNRIPPHESSISNFITIPQLSQPQKSLPLLLETPHIIEVITQPFSQSSKINNIHKILLETDQRKKRATKPKISSSFNNEIITQFPHFSLCRPKISKKAKFD
jgi:hypothetical protein